jgi:CDP-diacylglycerol--serine O-phosphatidyltransferase
MNPQLTQNNRPPRRFLRINVLASILTTMNLYMGTTSILASIGQEFHWAATCILLAIIFDTFDGFVARITNSVSDFGKELDSLCDMVSFGVAPAVLVFMAYLPPESHLPVSARAESIVGMTGSYMAIIYVICTALRLARFNTWHARQPDFFIGLPSPAAGGMLAAFVLFLLYFEHSLNAHALGSLAYVALGPMAVFVAFLMISSVRYPKNRLKTFLFKPRHAFQALTVTAFTLGIIHYAVVKSISLVLFPLACVYVLFGLGDTLHGRITGKTPASADLVTMDMMDHPEEASDQLETSPEQGEHEASGGDSLASF